MVQYAHKYSQTRNYHILYYSSPLCKHYNTGITCSTVLAHQPPKPRRVILLAYGAEYKVTQPARHSPVLNYSGEWSKPDTQSFVLLDTQVYKVKGYCGGCRLELP